MEGVVEYITTKNGGVIKLPPGFRFHPTDEELVTQYLRRKVASLPLPATIIPEINLRKSYDPWDLHGGGEGERYFFTTLEDVRHGSIRRTNSGFWKAKGKAKATFASRGGRIVGMKTTFVFYRQEKKRPTSHKINNGASRTNWIMDEYRLPEIDALSFYIHRNAAAMVNGLLPVEMKDWVVCKIFQKDSSKRVLVGKKEREQESNNYLVPSLSLSSCLTDLEEEREKEEEEEISS